MVNLSRLVIMCRLVIIEITVSGIIMITIFLWFFKVKTAFIEDSANFLGKNIVLLG